MYKTKTSYLECDILHCYLFVYFLKSVFLELSMMRQ